MARCQTCLSSLALGLIAGATIALGLEQSAAQAAEPIGAARCGSCHEDAYRQWQDSAHARSLSLLTESQRKDPTCRSCHTLAPASNDPALVGVQCESCHGLGSDYAPEHVMRDARLARLLGLAEVDAKTCRTCHEGVDARLRPYDYRKLVQQFAHGGRADEASPSPAR